MGSGDGRGCGDAYLLVRYSWEWDGQTNSERTVVFAALIVSQSRSM